MTFANSHRFILASLACLLLACLPAPADDWLPITEAERQLKEVPGNPGAPAIMLYREAFHDDILRNSAEYIRIKVFTEEGRKYADVQIPYPTFVEIFGIKARTVAPDGTVRLFEGQVFEKPGARRRGQGWMVKSFTLPEVGPGSIIEYKFEWKWRLVGRGEIWFFPPTWVVQHELFTRRARFTFRPFDSERIQQKAMTSDYRVYMVNPRIMWTTFLSRNLQPQMNAEGFINLEIENVPAFPQEELMPPADELKQRVYFFYASRDITTPDTFWARVAGDWSEQIEKFVKKRKGIEQVVAGVAAPSDPPETKLRKLYARVQQLRNRSFEVQKTEAEEQREKLKENDTAEDVLRNGYGNRTEINRTFVALARAAGFSAAVVRVAERDEVIFQKHVLDPTQLSGEAAVVELDGKALFLDPGTAFCPFGMLAWQKANTVGLRVEGDRYAFLTTPRSLSEEARIEVRADLQLGAEGTLSGAARVSLHGRSAMSRRLAALRQDEAGRKKSLTELMQSWLPARAEVTLEDVGGWDATEEPLSARFSVKIADWAAATGQRLLVPVAVFDSTRKHPFQHATRVHPIDFQYPIEEVDELTIQLPDGFAIEGLPEPHSTTSLTGEYRLASERDGNTLRIRRRLARTRFLYSAAEYSSLRRFYDDIRAGDSDQVVLRAEETGATR